jgi:exodeoxyribonuclease VII large subunit
MPAPSSPPGSPGLPGAAAKPTGIPGSGLPGPYGVGEYAAALRTKLRSMARVQLVGELVNLRPSRARVYFELRDGAGAIPCAVWLKDWESICARAGAQAATVPAEGMQVVVAGGCDFYPGSATSSPGFSFSVADLRVAGEGDLLARIERLRRALDAEGLLAPQKLLPRPLLPRTIGVVTAETGKVREDILAGLRRRGWAGRIVWGFAPVQDRHAAPLIARALTDLAAVGGVEVAIVARGGGSLADLLCFCEESLCRTVALLAVPVIASVGHHTDRTLLDDVAAVSCSTPTHAAEAAVGMDCTSARTELVAGGAHPRARPPRRADARTDAHGAVARALRPRRAPARAAAPAPARDPGRLAPARADRARTVHAARGRAGAQVLLNRARLP